MILSLTSKTMTQGQMYDAASTVVAQKLSQLTGVGEVEIGGGSLPAVRVDINPQALSQYGVGFEDVRAAVAASNSHRPKGMLESNQQQWQIATNSPAHGAAEYLPVFVKYHSGAAVQLGDVAKVADSVQDVRTAGSSNGEPSVLVIIRRESDANILDTVNRVNQVLPAIQASIPEAIDVAVVMERTSTVLASIRDAGDTLFIAVILVVLVVLLFLRNGRACAYS